MIMFIMFHVNLLGCRETFFHQEKQVQGDGSRSWMGAGGTSLRSFVRAAAQGAGKKFEMMDLLFLFWWKRSCCYWPGIVPAADKAMEKLHLQEELQREAREKLRVQSQFKTWVKNVASQPYWVGTSLQMLPNDAKCIHMRIPQIQASTVWLPAYYKVTVSFFVAHLGMPRPIWQGPGLLPDDWLYLLES